MAVTKNPVNPEELPQTEVRETTLEAEGEVKTDVAIKTSLEQESVLEQQAEKEGTATTEKQEAASGSGSPAVQSKTAAVSPVTEKSPDFVEIEKILSAGLDDLYSQMPEIRKKEFKEKGEEAVGKIENLLNSAKVKIGKIVHIIKNWLALIPGVNRFFLEQEAKIKADQLLNYKAEREKRN